MAVSSDSSSPSLEFYRKQAKALHKAVLSADASSLDRVRVHLNRFNPSDPFLLSKAQWVIAREMGHDSWPKFKQSLEAGELPAASENASAVITAPAAPQPEKAAKIAKSRSMSDEAVKAKTGRDWQEWFEIFDQAGGAAMTHQQIVAIARDHGAGSWWQQMVTVEYERARGMRDMNMSCFGDYRINASKTINASAVEVFNAWNDPAVRSQWLPGVNLTIRKANEGKNLRITFEDRQNVDVNLTAKSDTKCQCNVEHSKLEGASDVEFRKAFWGHALERLKALLEG